MRTDVQGSTAHVNDSSGVLVKVTITPTTPITRTSNSTDGGLQTGDTVVVRGTKAADGTVTATAITATAKGAQRAGTGQTGGPGGFGPVPSGATGPTGG